MRYPTIGEIAASMHVHKNKMSNVVDVWRGSKDKQPKMDPRSVYRRKWMRMKRMQLCATNTI